MKKDVQLLHRMFLKHLNSLLNTACTSSGVVCVFTDNSDQYTGVCVCVSYCTAAGPSSVSRASGLECARPPAPPGVCCTSPSGTHSVVVESHPELHL